MHMTSSVVVKSDLERAWAFLFDRADNSAVGDDAGVSSRRDLRTPCSSIQPRALSVVPYGAAFVHAGAGRTWGVHHPRDRTRASIPMGNPDSCSRAFQQGCSCNRSGLAE